MTSIYFRAVFFPALPILTLGVYLPIDHNNHGIDPSKFMFAHSQLLSLPTSRADSNLGLHRRRPPHCPLLHLRYQVNFTFCLSFHCIVLYLYVCFIAIILFPLIFYQPTICTAFAILAMFTSLNVLLLCSMCHNSFFS